MMQMSMKKIAMSLMCATVLFGVAPLACEAASTWLWDGGGGANPNASVAANWCNITLNQNLNTSTPATGDSVQFGGTGTSNCTPSTNNASWDILPSGSVVNFTVNTSGTAYTGTITIVPSTPLVVTGTLTLNCGTFAANSDVTAATYIQGASAIVTPNARTFTVNGAGGWTQAGTFNVGTSTVKLTATTSTLTASSGFYNLTIGDGAAAATVTAGGNFTVSNVFTIAANATFNGSTRTITLSGSAGTPFVKTGTFQYATSTISYTGTVDQNIMLLSGTGGNDGYYNLILGPVGSGHIWTLGTASGQTLAVNGDLTIGSAQAGTFKADTYNPTINLYGNLTFTSTTNYTPGTGTVTFTGTAAKTWTDNNPAGANNLGVVVINKTNTTSPSTNDKITLGANAYAISVSIDNTVGQADTLSAGANVLTLTGSGSPFSVPSGATFSYGTGAVVYWGTGTVNITALTGTGGTNGYYDLRVTGSGVNHVLTGTTVANGTGFVNVGSSLSLNGQNLTIKGGDLTGTGTIYCGNGNNTLPVSGGTCGGTVLIDGAGNLGGGTYTFYDLTLGDGSGATTTTAAGDFTVINVFTIATAQTFNGGVGNYRHTLAGNSGAPFVRSGTFTANTDTIIYTGNNAAGNTTILSTTYNNLQINGADTYVPEGVLTANGTFTLTSGTLDTTAFSITGILTAGSMQLDAGTTLLAGSNNITITSGDVTIASGVTFNNNAGSVLSFWGSGNQLFTCNDPNVVFYGITVNKTGGTVTLGSTIKASGLNSTVTISGGTLEVSTQTLDVREVRIQGGTLSMSGSGGILKLNNNNFPVGLYMTSGTFYTAPGLATPPCVTITGGAAGCTTNGANYYPVNLGGSGIVDVSGLTLHAVQSVNISGATNASVRLGGTITRFDNVTLNSDFQTTANTDAMLDLTGETVTLGNIAFPASWSGGEVNVRANTSGTITMVGASGAFAGPANEAENGGTIDWIGSLTGDGRAVFSQATASIQVQSYSNASGTFQTDTSFSVTGTVRYVQAKQSPLANGPIISGMLTTATGSPLYVYRRDALAGTWAAASFSPVNLGVNTVRAFDIAYEQNTGNPLVVYRDTGTTHQLLYQTSSDGGVTWSTGTCAGGVSGQAVQWVRLIPRPNSNEIAVVWSDGGDDAWAAIWNGTQCTNASGALTTNLTTTDNQKFDAAAESVSGQLLVTAAITGTAAIKYTTLAAPWASTSWSAPSNCVAVGGTVSGNMCQINPNGAMAGAASAGNQQLASDPSSNKIAWVGNYTNSGTASDVYVGIWNGTQFTATIDADTAMRGQTLEFNSSVEWLGTTGKAVMVYADAADTGLSWALYNGTSWAAQTDALSGSTTKESIRLVRVPFTTKVIALIQTTDGALKAYAYNGSAWNSLGTLTASSDGAGGYQSFDLPIIAYGSVTVSGAVKGTDESSVIGNPPCDGSTTTIVKIKVNGTGTYSGSCNSATGAYSISNVPVSASASSVITAYLADTLSGTPKRAVTVTRAAAFSPSVTAISGLDLYQNRVIVRHDDAGPITNGNLGMYDSTGDAAIQFTVSSGALTVLNSNELHIWTGDTFAPGGAVTVPGDWHNTGTLTPGTNTVTLTSTSAGAQLTSGSSSFYGLTVNGSGGTYTLQDNLTVTDQLLLSAGTLAAGNKTITFSGTTGRSLFVNGGSFSPGTSTVVYSGNNPATDDGSSVWTTTDNLGSGIDIPYTTAVDNTGVYVGGYATILGSNGFVRKYNSVTGNLLWSQVNITVIPVQVQSMAVTSTGVYAAGYTFSGADFLWKVAKLDPSNGAIVTAFGGGTGYVTSNPSASDDRVTALAVDASGLYVVGYDYATGNYEWRIEKRDLTTGALITGFGTNGVVTQSAGLVPYGVTVDATALYIVGYDSAPGNSEWRIEKRDLTTGALITGFGTNGVVTRNPTSLSDIAQAVVVDSSGLYVGGYDQPATRVEWRIEKFDRTTGSVLWTRTDTQGCGDDTVGGMALNSGGLYVAGTYNTCSYNGGPQNWMMRKYALSGGAPVWTQTYDSGNTDSAAAIALDSTGIYVVGRDGSPGQSNPQWRIEKRAGPPNTAIGAATYYDLQLTGAETYELTGATTVSHVLTVGASATLDGRTSTLTLSGSGTPFALSGALTPGSGTVTYTGTSATNVPAATYNNLLLQPAATVIYTLGGGTLTANSDLTIGNGSNALTVKADTNNPTITIGGNLTLSTSSRYTKGTGTTTLTGTSKTIDTFFNTDDLGAIVMNGTYSLNSNIRVTTIAINDGQSLDLSNNVLYISGGGTPFTFPGSGTGTLTTPNGGVTYTGASPTISLKPSYGTLGFNVSGTAVIPSGTLTTTSFSITTGTVTASGNPTINISGTLSFSSGITYTKGTGTTTLKPTGTKGWTDNTASGQDLGTVVIGSGSSTPKISLGSITVKATSLTIDAGHELTIGSNNTLILTGSGTPLTVNGTFTANGGTVSYTSGSGVSALSSVAMTGSNTFYKLQINGTGTFTAGVNFNATNALILSSGTLNIDSSTINVGTAASTGNIYGAGGLTCTLASNCGNASLTLLGSGVIGGTQPTTCGGTNGTYQFYNLTLGQSGNTKTTIACGNFSVDGVNGMTIAPNHTFDGGTGNFTLTFGWFVNKPLVISAGATFTPNTNTVVYANTTIGTNVTVTSTTYNHLTVAPGKPPNAEGDIVVNGNLAVTASTFAMQTFNLTVGTGTQTSSSLYGAGAITQTSGTTTLKGTTYLGGTAVGSCSGTNGSFQFYNLTVGDNVNAATTTLCGDVTASNVFTVAGGTATQTFNGGTSKTLTIGGAGTGGSAPFVVNGTFTPSTGKIKYTGGAATDVKTTTYYDLETNGTGPYNAVGALIATNSVTAGGGTLALGTNNLTVGTGSANGHIVGAGLISQTSGTTTLKGAGNLGGTSAAVAGTCSGTNGSFQFYNLTVGDNANAKTTYLCGNVTASNVFTVAGGTANQTFDGGSKTMTLSGSGTPFVINGTFTPNTGTVQYTSSTGATVTGTTYYRLVNFPPASTTMTLNGDITVNSTLNDCNNGALHIAGSVFGTAATLDTAGFSVTVPNGGVTTGNCGFGGQGVLKANGSIIQIGSGSVAGNLYLNDQGDALTGTPTMTVTGTAAGYAGINFTGGSFTQRVFSTGQTFGATGDNAPNKNWVFNDLKFENSSGGALTIQTNSGGTLPIVVNGTLTVGNASNSATTTLDDGTNNRILSVPGNVTITSKGSLTAPASASFTVGGNWTNSNVFTHNNGTVTFNGSGTQTINPGSSSFYNVTAATAGAQLNFTAGTTTTVANALTFTGTDPASGGSLILLRSTTPGTQWNLSATGTNSISYVDVQDSNACPNTVTATYSLATSNDDCWNIGAGGRIGAPTGSGTLEYPAVY